MTQPRELNTAQYSFEKQGHVKVRTKDDVQLGLQCAGSENLQVSFNNLRTYCSPILTKKLSMFYKF